MIGALALLLVAQAATPDVRTLPDGAQIIIWEVDTRGWTEARLAFTTPEAPPARPGLGAVAANVLRARLDALNEVGPSLRVRRRPSGLVIALAAPSDRIEGVVQAALRAAIRPEVTAEALAVAASAAARDRQSTLRDADALARMELGRAFFARAPAEEAREAFGAVSAAEASAFLRATFTRARARLILTGAPPESAPEAWLATLPSGTSTVTARGLPPRRDGPLEVIVVDDPSRSEALVRLGWRPKGGRSEAVYTAAANCLGPGAAWRAPLMTLSSTSALGGEAGVLKGMLQRLEDAAGQEPSPPRWRRAVATATRAVALSLRDAPSAADSLALDRVDPQRTLRPVLHSSLAALRAPPGGVGPMFRTRRPVAVIVTSVTARLSAQLHALAEGAQVRVVAWDQR